jgi:hypothetical protein
VKTLLFVLLALLPLRGQASLPSSLTAHLKDAAIVHVDFTQTRTLAALTRPLKASGSLVLARDLGVIWALRRPTALTYVMGPKGLMVVNAAGRRERKSAREVPVVAQMGRVFSGLIQGDWNSLEAYFTVAGEGTPQHWEVTLLPKPQTAAFLKKVQLSGGRFIERIRVIEASGDLMELAFEHQRLDLPLTEGETRLLAQD